MPETSNGKLPKKTAVAQNAASSRDANIPVAEKKGSAGIFVTIICLIIAVVCLVPFFMGSDEEPQTVARTASLTQTESAQESSDVIIDEGALQEPLPTGIDAQTPELSTTQQVVISGEELSEIEKNFKKPGAESDIAAENRPSDSTDPGSQALTSQIPLQDTPFGAQTADNDASKPLRRQHSSVRAAIREAKKDDNADTIPTTVTTAENRSSAAGSSLMNSSVVRPDNVPFSGEAIPGGSSELNLKNQAHFTVQVVSGSSKDNVIEVSAGLRGRYWIYETVHEGRPWYVLITGEYPTREAALDAAAKLPSYVRGAKPFPKSFATVMDEISSVR